MNPKALHGRCAVAAQRASFDEVVLSNVFVLEVGSHRDLALETSITNWAMVRQALGVCGKVFGQMVFSEEPFLAHPALVGFDAGVSHLVAPHVGAVRKLHVTDVAFEQLSVRPRVGGLRASHIVVVR